MEASLQSVSEHNPLIRPYCGTFTCIVTNLCVDVAVVGGGGGGGVLQVAAKHPYITKWQERLKSLTEKEVKQKV